MINCQDEYKGIGQEANLLYLPVDVHRVTLTWFRRRLHTKLDRKVGNALIDPEYPCWLVCSLRFPKLDSRRMLGKLEGLLYWKRNWCRFFHLS